MSTHGKSALGEALGILAGSAAILVFAGLVLVAAPYMQLKEAPVPEGLEPYTDKQAAGREQYVSLGCMYCHSQQPRDPSQAPDMKRGWGRPSIPADYTYDYPHQLGTMRTGPDLMNIGARQPSRDWHLLHLYQPRAVSPDSLMPAYPFLFEIKEAAAQTDVVVRVPGEHAPPTGEVVAKPEALALVAYLKAMDRTYPIDLEKMTSTNRTEGDDE